ncbi:MAG TPA: SH3 domain-containing protein, partial [Pyrinomonadaceae bacterium]|nr:SH3 domain-containing protein [Pyrinomonadaceae bacterium]
MRPHNLTVSICLVLLLTHIDALGQRKPPAGGRLAVVVDERLAALRAAPQLNGKIVRRLGRGRLVAITGAKTSADGIVFYRVNVTTRTRGWIQRESVVSASRAGDDHRLL